MLHYRYLVVSGRHAVGDLRLDLPSGSVLQWHWTPERLVALIDLGEDCDNTFVAIEAHRMSRLDLGVTVFFTHDDAVRWANETFGYLTDETFRFATLQEIKEATLSA